jgi:hypothetical protein
MPSDAARAKTCHGCGAPRGSRYKDCEWCGRPGDEHPVQDWGYGYGWSRINRHVPENVTVSCTCCC